jgi:hypothetical protein
MALQNFPECSHILFHLTIHPWHCDCDSLFILIFWHSLQYLFSYYFHLGGLFNYIF